MEVLAGKLHTSSLAIVENYLRSIGDIVEAREGLRECVLFQTSVRLCDIIWFESHIITPPDGSAPGAAHSSTVSRSRSVRRLPRDPTQVFNTGFDVTTACFWPIVALDVVSFAKCRHFPLIQHCGKVIVVVGVDL